MEQMDDKLGAAVASRRQGVPGRRHDRDPKGVVYPAHLLPARWGNPIIAVGPDGVVCQKVDSAALWFENQPEGSIF